MQILDKIKGFGNKVNFVDKNNVCVGYDLTQDCCEHADWFISDLEESKAYDKEGEEKTGNTFDLGGYVFDKTYKETVESPDVDGGGMVRFKLVNGDMVKYLHLYNCQNGYYGHGFEFKDGDEVIWEDCL